PARRRVQAQGGQTEVLPRADPLALPEIDSLSKQKIGEASLILAGGTILSNLFQILKMILISRLFGATSGLLDPYVVALRVPMAVQGIILGTLQMSFIPVYVGHLARKEHDRAERVLGSTFSFGMLFYGLF